jgi:hypothetical protein
LDVHGMTETFVIGEGDGAGAGGHEEEVSIFRLVSALVRRVNIRLP